MAKEIVIEIGKDGKMVTQMTGFQKDDPACFNFQKLINANKELGVDMENIHMDERSHGHSHSFEQMKTRG